MHEIIHAEQDRPDGKDLSHQLMVEAARWKIEFPDQVHFLHSNHEMSQLTGKEICKGGRIVNYDFEASLADTYAAGAQSVLEAICGYISSFALAGRTQNRVFLSHSLPNVSELPNFDASILNRSLSVEDLQDGGSAYMIVWGRNHPPQLLERMGEMLDVDWFLCGHQPQELGSTVVNDRMIILASDHNHGTFLPFDLKKTYTIDELSRFIRPISAIA